MEQTRSGYDLMMALHSPQLLYYLLLYVLVILMRAIRTYRGQNKTDAAAYAFFGLEMVNVSAGVFIMLTETANDFIAPLVMLYVILIIIGFFVDDDGVNKKLKVILNFGVSIVVLIVTGVAFSKYSYEFGNGVTNKDIKWHVAVPYIDASLNRTLSVKNDVLRSFYTVEVTAPSRKKALIAARDSFYGNGGPQPFVPKSDKSEMSMIWLSDNAVTSLSS